MILISFLNKLDSLALGGAKTSFDGVDILDVSGTKIDMPYVSVIDEGSFPDEDFEYNGVEVRKFIVNCYDVRLADVVALAKAIMYNGGTPQQALGMDNGQLSDNGFQKFMSCIRTTDKYSREDRLDSGTQFVHKCEIKYDVKTSIGQS